MIRSLIARGAAALALLSLAASPALSSTITVKDGAGASQAIGTTTRASDAALIYNMDTVVQGVATDIGASVPATTATTLAAANPTRRGFSIQNQTAGNCWLNGVATPTGTYHDLLIVAGSYYESKDSHVGTGMLQIYCASAGGVYARQW